MTTIDRPTAASNAHLVGFGRLPDSIRLDRPQLLGLLRVLHTDGRRPADGASDRVLERLHRARRGNAGGGADLPAPVCLLADLLTVLEHTSMPLSQLTLCHVGDARTEQARALLTAGSLLGLDVRLAAPQRWWPADSVVAQAEGLAVVSGARLLITADAGRAVAGADVVVAGTWDGRPVWDGNGSAPAEFVVDRALLDSCGGPHPLILCSHPENCASAAAPRALAHAQLRNRRRVAEILSGTRFLS
ncbi:MAG: hypothetical protein ACT4QF_21905 [Sporichthyaceae bacterium]